MERLVTSHGTFSVYLNQLQHSPEKTFLISFVDRKNKTHIFQMSHNGYDWLINQPGDQPHWVLELEGKLNTLIEKEIRVNFASMMVAV